MTFLLVECFLGCLGSCSRLDPVSLEDKAFVDEKHLSRLKKKPLSPTGEHVQ